MIPPQTHFKTMFGVRSGKKQVKFNLEQICLQIVAYFREVVPISLAIASHPAFGDTSNTIVKAIGVLYQGLE